MLQRHRIRSPLEQKNNFRMRKESAMQLLKFSAVFSALIFSASPHFSIAEELKGDAGLACSALLCLSSATKPAECGSALSKYFSIHKKKWKDTLNARRSFLKLCPVAGEEGMPELTDAIVQGAGQCEVGVLNGRVETKEFQICKKKKPHQEPDCYYVTKYRINSSLPSYCKAYFNNQYTDFSVKYIGSGEWQEYSDFKNNPNGKWVEIK